MKWMISTFTLMFGLSTFAMAHNVVSGVYGDGLLIEGEIGFSNGEMAQAGVQVNIFDESGKALGQTTLDENGAFQFQANSAQKHMFKADLGAGHVASMTLEADELSAGASVTKREVAPANVMAETKQTTSKSTTNNVSISTDELQSLIRSAVAQQVRPLQKELSAYKEKVMFRDITGGLGFIFGLFGVAAWMAAKRHEKKV